jgi:hypothetical protein
VVKKVWRIKEDRKGLGKNLHENIGRCRRGLLSWQKKEVKSIEIVRKEELMWLEELQRLLAGVDVSVEKNLKQKINFLVDKEAL